MLHFVSSGPLPHNMDDASHAKTSSDNKKPIQRYRNYSLSNPPMPWFGADIGGTLVKLVYFEPTDGHPDDEQEIPLVTKIRKYLTKNTSYGDTGVRDDHLQLDNQLINFRRGTLHFIRFPVASMPGFIKLAKSKGFAACASTVSATGGGAFKFEKLIRDELNMELFKYDEMQSLITGIQYVVENNPGECYYFLNPLDGSCSKVAFNQPLRAPYLVVNVGSGVSVLCVDQTHQFKRVTGTSLGGGMFHGLCCLLTGCKSFEEALELASRGDNSRVDKLVKDIYGGDYDLFNLPGDTVASSFGHMIDQEKRQEISREDLACSALVTITNNIGSIAKMCADNLGYFGAVGCLFNLMKFSEARKQQKNLEISLNHATGDHSKPQTSSEHNSNI